MIGLEELNDLRRDDRFWTRAGGMAADIAEHERVENEFLASRGIEPEGLRDYCREQAMEDVQQMLALFGESIPPSVLGGYIATGYHMGFMLGMEVQRRWLS